MVSPFQGGLNRQVVDRVDPLHLQVDPLHRRVAPLHRQVAPLHRRVDSPQLALLDPRLQGCHRHLRVEWPHWPQALLKELRRVRLLDRRLPPRARKSASKPPLRQPQRREPVVLVDQRERQLARTMQQPPPLRPLRLVQLLA